MMMMQMPVVLLIEAMRPVSLFRTVLTDAGAGAGGTIGHRSIIAAMLLLLVLLQMEVMLLVMGMGQPTATSGHSQLLLWMTAWRKIRLTVDASWH